MKRFLVLLALIPAVASAHSFLPFRLESPYKETVVAQFVAANYYTVPAKFEVEVLGPDGKPSEDAYASPQAFGLKPNQNKTVKIKIEGIPQPGIYKVCTTSQQMNPGGEEKSGTTNMQTRICSAWGVGVSPYDKSVSGHVSDKKQVVK